MDTMLLWLLAILFCYQCLFENNECTSTHFKVDTCMTENTIQSQTLLHFFPRQFHHNNIILCFDPPIGIQIPTLYFTSKELHQNIQRSFIIALDIQAHLPWGSQVPGINVTRVCFELIGSRQTRIRPQDQKKNSISPRTLSLPSTETKYPFKGDASKWGKC